MTIQDVEIQRQHSFGLHGQVALIVGGYGAIGAVISETLAIAGAISIVAGRSGDRARAFAAELSDKGLSVQGIELDACDVAAVRRLLSSLKHQYGAIDILVNCVGLNREQPLLEVTEDAFDKIYCGTLRAGMFLAQAVAAQQVAAEKGGSHIHILSLRSSLGFRGRGYSAFCAAKGGLAILLKQHATELAPYGITVNGVAPGAVRTHKNHKALEDAATLQQAISDVPLRRLATPSDVAGAVHFFASPLSRFVTGQILHVDGGLTASA
ncbi:SDR family oxidoreductase [Bradyrhizobium sp. Pear77]|uniref:SDR family NAD(P)-dependent oxidoreductase n=1 Tax=Bradyrhizobium altum TaxID=1571202 RepID=UPI001E31B4B9|nr:SDR family oxidoreductase [Bradyrhizobium altum]MCC8957956.1 SDR family oxidoreductase [Bradyrhizobium altum]